VFEKLRPSLQAVPLVFCRGFEAPRAPAQVDDPWFLGLVVTGRVFLVAGGTNLAFFSLGVGVCSLLYSGLGPSRLVYYLFIP